MPDQTTWLGGDGNPNDAGNWSNGLPGATKQGVFDGTSSVRVNGGGAGTWTCLTTRDYLGGFGSAGNPVVWTSTGISASHLEASTFRHQGDDYMRVNTGAVNIDKLNGTVSIEGGLIDNKLTIKSGVVTVAADVSLVSTELVVTGANSRLTIQAGTGTPVILIVDNGGQVFNYRDWITGGTGDDQIIRAITMEGGLMDWRGVIENNTVLQVTGGEFLLRPGADFPDSPGPIAYVNGCIFDARNNQYATEWKTFIIGPTADFKGNLKSEAPQTNVIDLREDFP